MSLIKKSDVKNHLSVRFRKEIHVDNQSSQPDATGFSEDEPEACNAIPSDFATDFQVEHSFSGTVLAPGEPMTGSAGPQAPAASKSAQT